MRVCGDKWASRKWKSALGQMGSTGRKGWFYSGREVIKSFLTEAVLKLNIARCTGNHREGKGEQR